MKALFAQKGATLDISILADKPAQDFINAHAGILDSSFQQVGMSDAMRQSLRQSDYIFSGIKTFHQLNQAFPSLIDENGERKSFEHFLKDVQSIDETYNHNYLRAEYNFIHASASMAAKWEQIEQDGDRYNLQYRTAGDSRVRKEHQRLNGITLPPSDPFWAHYYPPNGWNCRCTAVQVRKTKHPATSHDQAMKLGDQAVGHDAKGIFRFNSGLQRKTVPDYNPYTIKRCNSCDVAKGNIKLAKAFVPETQLCEACNLIHICERKWNININEDIQPPHAWEYEKKHNGMAMVSPYHGKEELAENLRLAEKLSDFYGTKVYLLPKLDPLDSKEAELRKILLPEGVPEGKSPDFYIGGLLFDGKSMAGNTHENMPVKWKNDIENRIKSAKKQADNMVIEVPDFMSQKIICSTVLNYLRRSKKERIIIIKRKEQFYTYKKTDSDVITADWG